MLCDNILCVFWSYSKCSLPEISLDEIGQCNECDLIGLEPGAAEAAYFPHSTRP